MIFHAESIKKLNQIVYTRCGFNVVKLTGSSRVAEYASRSLSGYLVGKFGECKCTLAGYL